MKAFIIHSTVDKDPLDFDQFMAPPDYYNDEENQTNEYKQYPADPHQSREAAKKLGLCKFWASQESSYPLLSPSICYQFLQRALRNLYSRTAGQEWRRTLSRRQNAWELGLKPAVLRGAAGPVSSRAGDRHKFGAVGAGMWQICLPLGSYQLFIIFVFPTYVLINCYCLSNYVNPTGDFLMGGLSM